MRIRVLISLAVAFIATLLAAAPASALHKRSDTPIGGPSRDDVAAETARPVPGVD